MAVKTVTLHSDNDCSTPHQRKMGRIFKDAFADMKERRWALAADGFSKCVDLMPFPSLCNRGMCYHHMARPQDAMADYDRAMAIGTPALRHVIRVNRGTLLAAVGRYDEALEDFLADDSPEGKVNASFIYLQRGEYKRGLDLYRNRHSRMVFRLPSLTLDDLRGKSVLIIHEQGMGDSIMMARFLPEIVAIAKSVTWSTRVALIPLLQQIPGVTFTSFNDMQVKAWILKSDCAIMAMDLWEICGLKIDGKPYLSTSECGPRFGIRLPIPRYGGPVVGLAWRGLSGYGNDHVRTTTLDEFYPPPPLSNEASFVSLQLDLREDEKIGLFDAGSLIKNFADTAAILTQLDALITVDTAVAHLAGAMGVRTALILPFSPDWRWGLEGSKTPWYDSFRLFRQKSYGDWTEPVSAAAAALVRCVDW